MSTKREIPFGRPWITDDERKAVDEVLRGHILTHGPECKAFEAEYSDFMGDAGYAVSVSSCMAALHLAYFQMGLGKGDEVIVPAMTHTATGHAVEIMGAKPVFCDCEKETGNIDVTKIEALITDKTKAISLVHYLGIPCDMDAICAIAEKHDLKIVEDCALAVGARYKGKHVGLIGDCGCYSFYPVKHITTGEGGFFVTKHEALAAEVAQVRGFGVDRTHGERKIPGLYDVTMLGLNYRMSEVSAAIGRGQIRKLPEILKKRKENFKALKNALADIEETRVLDTKSADAENSCYCLVLIFEGKLSEKRNDILLALKARNIGSSIYYPQPVPRMTYYKEKYGYDESLYRNAAEVSDSGIALPVGPHLDTDDMKYIGEQLKIVIKEV